MLGDRVAGWRGGGGRIGFDSDFGAGLGLLFAAAEIGAQGAGFALDQARFRLTRFRVTGFRLTGFRLTGFRLVHQTNKAIR